MLHIKARKNFLTIRPVQKWTGLSEMSSEFPVTDQEVRDWVTTFLSDRNEIHALDMRLTRRASDL